MFVTLYLSTPIIFEHIPQNKCITTIKLKVLSQRVTAGKSLKPGTEQYVKPRTAITKVITSRKCHIASQKPHYGNETSIWLIYDCGVFASQPCSASETDISLIEQSCSTLGTVISSRNTFVASPEHITYNRTAMKRLRNSEIFTEQHSSASRKTIL